MGWLAKRRERKRLERERIERIEREYKDIFSFAHGTFYLNAQCPAPPLADYVFYPMLEDDIDFQPVALEAMTELFREYTVITHVDAREKSEEVIDISQGLNVSLMRRLIDQNLWCEPHQIYAYSVLPFETKTYEQAMQGLGSKSFDFNTALYQEHDHLDMTIHSERVNIAAVADTLATVCRRHGKTLKMDIDTSVEKSPE